MTDKEKKLKRNQYLKNKRINDPAYREQRAEAQRRYRERHKEKVKIKQREYGQRVKEQIAERQKKYNLDNLEKVKAQKLKWLAGNKEKRKEIARNNYLKNKEARAIKQKEWINNNRNRLKEYYKTARAKIKLDPCKRLAHVVRSVLVKCLKKSNTRKTSRTVTFLGCSVQEYKLYLESLFEPWMTWDNHGSHKSDGVRRWNIDHIIPLSHFDLTDPEKQKVAFHYTNTRPLEAFKNISEGNRRPRPERHKTHD